MTSPVKILILENDPNDFELLQYELKRSGLYFVLALAQSRQDFEQLLGEFKPDIILSDYTLPSFDGLAAFRIKQSVSPDTPYIIVSGTLGEERAVELIKMGITDYALKENLYQIAPKIERALNEATERKQKEAAQLQLKQREEQLQKIMDFSLDVICTTDAEGRFVTVSAASERLWGYTPEELREKQAVELIYEEDRPATISIMSEIKNGVDCSFFENRFVHKNGSLVTLFWSGHWVAEEQLLYGIARDGTEIRKAEEKIRNNEKRFRSLLLNSTDGLLLLSADGRVVERSNTALKILGLKEDNVSESFRIDLVYPTDRHIVENTLNRVQANPKAVETVEYRIQVPDGNYIWLETTIQNQLTNPAVAAIILNFRDITERKLAKTALEKSEEKYRDLFNLSPTPMWLFDMNSFRFLDVNEAAVMNYGYTKKEFLSMTAKDIRPEEEITALEKAIQVLKNKKVYYNDLTRHYKKNGEIIYVDTKKTAVDLDGVEAMLVSATDISERIKYIKAIEEQNAKLREVAWMQSHVVRAPLARMMGLISLLEKEKPSCSEISEILGYLQSSAYELDGIIREIVAKTEQVQEPSALKERAGS
mgnify:CR=1 FL=1